MTSRSSWVVLIAFIALSAHAQSAEEQKLIQTYKDGLTQSLPKLEEACGLKIAVVYDFDSEPKDLKEQSNGHYEPGWGYSVCQAVGEYIAGMCSDAAMKATVKAKLKSIRCKYVKDTTAQMYKKSDNLLSNAIQLKKGELTIEFDYRGSNTGEEAWKVLTRSK